MEANFAGFRRLPAESVQLEAVLLVGCRGAHGDEPEFEPVGGSGGASTPGGGTPTSTFVSSVGHQGTGPIRDLKFTTDDPAIQPLLPAYVVLPIDLNQGAGGTSIYLTFTRSEAGEGWPLNCQLPDGPFVTSIIAEDFWLNSPQARCWESHTPIWEPAIPAWLGAWIHPDLNDGAGGPFIFAWQRKQIGVRTIEEVGVLAGNSRYIQCPAGWTRVEQDLNEGAGGDYIYFCYLSSLVAVPPPGDRLHGESP